MNLIWEPARRAQTGHCRHSHSGILDPIAATRGSLFLSLLTTLGIDPAKDGEVYHNGRLSPGKHHYGSWFHFIGTLDESGDFPPVELGTDFTVHLCHRSAPCLQELNGLPLVQLEFTASSVPWRLNEPEAD